MAKEQVSVPLRSFGYREINQRRRIYGHASFTDEYHVSRSAPLH